MESSANLLARYAIIEKLYIDVESEAKALLENALRKLYATVLSYLAKVKAHLSSSTGSM